MAIFAELERRMASPRNRLPIYVVEVYLRTPDVTVVQRMMEFCEDPSRPGSFDWVIASPPDPARFWFSNADVAFEFKMNFGGASGVR